MKKANLLYIVLQIALWGIYGVLYSYANRYLLSQGLSSTITGVLLALSTAVAFVLQPLLTSIIDKRKFELKGVLLMLSALMLVCSLILPFIKSLWAVATIYALAYIGVVVYPAFINAMGMVAIKSGYSVNFGLARGVGAFVFGITAWGTNKLIEVFSESAIPCFAIIFCLLAIGAVLIFPKGADAVTKKEDASKITDFFKRNKKFTVLLIAVATIMVGHNILGNCMYQIAVFKGDPNAQGMVLMISTLIEIPTIVFFTKLLKIASSSTYMRISGIFFVLRVLLSLVIPGVWGLYIAQICQIAGYGLYTVCSVYYTGEVVSDKDTVKGQTYICAANTIGCLIAHLTGGAMIDAVGVENMLIITTIISVIGMVMLFFTTEKTNSR
ncbi:MAG: MFS transporter [Clostridia bacterium]|nr:MFS transporter [Clostridia bacterium]